MKLQALTSSSLDAEGCVKRGVAIAAETENVFEVSFTKRKRVDTPSRFVRALCATH
jgi:hypothetical protein